MRVGVLASGSGTNFRALIENDIAVSVLLVDRECGAEMIATEANIPIERVLRSDFGTPLDRERFTEAVVNTLAAHRLDLIVMAGFMTVVTKTIVDEYPGRILNVHPALLPAYPGAHAVRDALKAGAKVTGCTIHIVTDKVDDGPILAQEPVPIEPGDTEASLHERIKAVERRLYPRVVKELVAQWPNAH